MIDVLYAPIRDITRLVTSVVVLTLSACFAYRLVLGCIASQLAERLYGTNSQLWGNSHGARMKHWLAAAVLHGVSQIHFGELAILIGHDDIAGQVLNSYHLVSGC